MNDIKKQLNQLRLNAIMQTVDLRSEQALTTQMTYTEYLSTLLDDELSARDTKRYEKRLKAANLKGDKTLSNFDFSFNTSIDKKVIYDLSTSAFVTKKQPVIIIGACGTGKTHLAQALGFAAIQKEFDVLMYKQNEISGILNEARATGTYMKKIKKLADTALLIIDDFALKPFTRQEEEDIHDLIDKRSEHTSTLITSNLMPHEWLDAFSNKLLGVATIDRLQFKSTFIKIDGKSYRSNHADLDDEDGFSKIKKEEKESIH
ncbi:MAG: IS21 family transposase ISAzo12 [Holosporales bacterium]